MYVVLLVPFELQIGGRDYDLRRIVGYIIQLLGYCQRRADNSAFDIRFGAQRSFPDL